MKIKTFTYNATRRVSSLEAPSKLNKMVEKELRTSVKIHKVKDTILKYPHLKEYRHQRIVVYD